MDSEAFSTLDSDLLEETDMSKPSELVYILTNPSLDGWVKIGRTQRDDIQQRLAELNAPTNIPLAFRAYALYHVDDCKSVEQGIHALIDLLDDTLRAKEEMPSGRWRQREFFRISPSKAYKIMRAVARIRGDEDQLELVAMTAEEEKEEAVARSRRPPLRFSKVGIPVGSTLTFLKDDSVVVTVVDENNKIEYNGMQYTTSRLASELLGGGSYAGPDYFLFEGETLTDRRRRLEQEASQDEEYEE